MNLTTVLKLNVNEAALVKLVMLLVNYKKNLPLPALVKLVWKVKAVSGVLGGGGSRWWRPRRDTSVPAPPVPATEARLKDLWG